jgi:hypothetical protein
MKTLSIMAALAVAVAAPQIASAAPPTCESLQTADSVPNIYMQVGDTQTNLLKRLGRLLRDNVDDDGTPTGTPHPIRIVFITDPSCTNINTIYADTATSLPMAQVMNYLPSQTEDPNWDPTKPTLTCTLAGPHQLDVANSALFNSACPTPPAGSANARGVVVPVQGPTQAYVLAVPTAAQPIAITFEEAYFVFGFGMAGMVTPWIDETQLFVRKTTTSTLLAWAANLGIPAGQFKGIQEAGSPDVAAHVIAGMPSALGILGAEVYDASRTTMRALAYRAKGQYAAYYPDSSSSARDKKNVRDGHYTVWSPTVWMYIAQAADGKTPITDDAAYVVNLITGNAKVPPKTFSVIGDAIAPVGLVPICAMGVNRDHEGGVLSLFTPPTSCVCKYEASVSTSSCVACDDTKPCAQGVCRENFCEAR